MSLQLLFPSLVFAFDLLLLFPGVFVDSLSYDYSATIKCLGEPLRPQYGGGIIRNPGFDKGLEGWTAFGDGNIEARGTTSGGNKFAVCHGRRNPYDSVSQKVILRESTLYTLSAWLKVDSGSAPVVAAFKTEPSGFVHAGHVVARAGCWTMLKGGVAVNVTAPAQLYFETQNRTDVVVWLDSVSLQPFTQEEWRSHRYQSIDKMRKRKVKFQVKDDKGKPLQGATISVRRKAAGFPFGCAISSEILTNKAYQRWFTSRGFTVTTFENEMKWYATERVQGEEDYSVSDAMLAFAKKNGLAVRGHAVLLNDPKFQMRWVSSLPPLQLQAAADNRVASVMSRYKGQLIAWDVVNENLHFSFFEDKLGEDASPKFYKNASELDPVTPLFMNEFNTLEWPDDPLSTPALYMAKMKEISSFNVSGKLAIGLQGHFTKPNLPYIRSALDSLAKLKLPIWITEVDVESDPKQAEYLEQILRELHAHPAVKGIVIWGARRSEGCYRMCLTDNKFKNLPTGDVVDNLLAEWGLSSSFGARGQTDDDGWFEANLFDGDYNLTVLRTLGNRHSPSMDFRVTPKVEAQRFELKP